MFSLADASLPAVRQDAEWQVCDVPYCERRIALGLHVEIPRSQSGTHFVAERIRPIVMDGLTVWLRLSANEPFAPHLEDALLTDMHVHVLVCEPVTFSAAHMTASVQRLLRNCRVKWNVVLDSVTREMLPGVLLSRPHSPRLVFVAFDAVDTRIPSWNATPTRHV